MCTIKRNIPDIIVPDSQFDFDLNCSSSQQNILYEAICHSLRPSFIYKLLFSQSSSFYPSLF